MFKKLYYPLELVSYDQLDVAAEKVCVSCDESSRLYRADGLV